MKTLLHFLVVSLEPDYLYKVYFVIVILCRDDANCGVLVRGMLDGKSRIDTFGGLAVVVRAYASHQLGNVLVAAQKW